MKLEYFLFLPFILQPATMLIDEFYFHIKRDLPRWERISHPIDTFLFLVCFVIVKILPFNETSLKIFLGASLLSCLSIIKDEIVHKKFCEGIELITHAILFICHSSLLVALYFFWKHNPSYFPFFLNFEILLITVYLLYQIIYWNFVKGPFQEPLNKL